MKRNILIIGILMVFSISMSAQRHTIYAAEFQSEVQIPQQVISTIRRAFIDGISNTNRVNIIDATAVRNTPGSNPLEEARRFKAEYLLSGNILKREATDDGNQHRRYHSRENSFKEKFTLRLDLIRAEDGVTVSTYDYEEAGSASGKEVTQYSALEHALTHVPYEMGGFVEKHFKVYGSIIRTIVITKDKVKTVYVDLGYEDPIKEGLRLDVMECETIEGNYTEKKIGEIRIKEILGAKISIGKVYDGEKELYTKIKEGKELKLISRRAKLFDGSNIIF